MRICCQRTRHALLWMAACKNTEVQMLIEANSKQHDIMIYKDSSVIIRDWPDWRFTVKEGGRTVHEDSCAYGVMTFSLTMRVEVVTHEIKWLASQHDSQITHAIILADLMNPLHKVESGMGCPDWHMDMHSIFRCTVDLLPWTCCCQREWTGKQTGKHSRHHNWSAEQDRLQHCRTDHLKERGVEKGSGQHSTLRLGMICVHPDKHWHCFKGNLEETAE